MVEIDGAHGEGGGQLVRTAVALSAVTGVPVRVVDIRAKRRHPGLAAQHAAAVLAVAALCDARCEGVQAHSTTLSFWPRRLRGGAFQVDVGTAGSIALVLQAMLPAALATGQRVEITVRGGTDVPMAPPMDYVRLVLLPLLALMGVQAELSIVRRGYFPQGGGEVRLVLQPVARLLPLVLEARGPIARVEVLAHVANLPRQIAERMAAAASAGLPPGLPVQRQVDLCAPELAQGPGGAIVLRAVAAHTTLGAAEVAARGVPAERLGLAAAQSLLRDLDAAATLDSHAADQMLAFLALADGPCAFRAAALGSHARTAMWLLEQLTPARFSVAAAGAGVLVRVQPGSGARG
jgi:RNA 3'-phosphate cyclase